MLKVETLRLNPRLNIQTIFLAFLVGLSAAVPPVHAAGPTNVSGAVTSDTTWTLGASPYIVAGDVTVYGTPAAPVTLTIEAGVEVRFNSSRKLTIGFGANRGALVAVGTVQAPIVFTSNQPVKSRGDWGRLELTSATDAVATEIEHVTVEYGGYGARGNLYVNGSSPTIRNAVIRESSNYGVYVYGATASPRLESTTIESNANFGIYVMSGSLELEDMTFSGTETDYAVSILVDTPLRSAGAHALDKPVELRNTRVATDTTWPNLGTYYVPAGSVYVYKDATEAATLTIEPGVEVRFQAGARLAVGTNSYRGMLVAEGTEDAPIVLTSNQPVQSPGDWDCVYLDSGSGASHLEHVEIEYGGRFGQADLHVRSVSPTIRNTGIRQSSGYGVYVYGSSAFPALDGVRIEDSTLESIYVAAGGLSLKDTSITGTGGAYAISMSADTLVTTEGAQSFDKPIELRYAVVSGDVVWRNLGVPYVSTGSPVVYKDTTAAATLTIEPGVEVRFAPGMQLTIGNKIYDYKGTLIARGTEQAPILFTSSEPIRNPGDWYDLSFTDGSDASILEYVTVEYAGRNTAGIRVEDSAPALRNCIVRESGKHGIHVTGSVASPLLDTVRIEESAEMAIYLGSRAGLALEGVTSVGTGSGFAMSVGTDTTVTASGAQSFDKPIELRGGGVTEDRTWPNLGVPYVLDSYVQICKNSTSYTTLILEPGVEIRFNQGGYFHVGYASCRGALMAVGTPDAPIVFTSNQTTPNPGDWHNIRFDSGDASNTLLENVIVEYAGAEAFSAIQIYGSSPVIRKSTIRHCNNNAVQVDAATAFPDLRDNNFIDIQGYGVNNTTSNGVDARASWWNDHAGPSGAGEPVSDNVVFAPWLGSVQNPYFWVADTAISHPSFNKHNGSTTLTADLSTPGDWTLHITNGADAIVKTYRGSGVRVEQMWNGEQDGGGEKVDDGLYTLRLTATETSSGQVMAPLLAAVTVEGGAGDPNAPVAWIASPVGGAVLQGGETVSIIGTATDADDFVSYRVEYGVGTNPQTWIAVTSPPDRTTQVEDGELAVWSTADLEESTFRLRLTVETQTDPDAVAEVAVRVLTLLDLQSSRQYISPNGDFIFDTTQITARSSLPSDWTLRIQDASGTSMRSYSGGGTEVSVVWDGRDEAGGVVPDGSYSCVLEATEPASDVHAGPVSGVVFVDCTGPTAEIRSPAPGSIVFDTVTITGTADEGGGIHHYQLRYGPGASPTSWRPVGNWTDPVVDGVLAEWETNNFTDEIPVVWGNGVHTIQLQVYDLAGNVSEDSVTVELDNLFISDVSASAELIHPLEGETTEITFDLNRDAAEALVRIVPETSPWKEYPDASPETDAVRTLDLGPLAAGSHSATWDGRNDAGSPVPDEAYIYVIEARTASGRFGKFNRFVREYVYPIPGDVKMPAEDTAYNPFINDFVTHTFEIETGPARGSFLVEYTDSSGATHQLFPIRDQLFFTGPNTVIWDGRDEAGHIVTDITSIRYLIANFVPGCSPCTDDDQTSFYFVKKNYVQVLGTQPEVPQVSIESDPYRMVLSYGHVVGLRYHLVNDAEVTVTVEAPDGSALRTLLVSESQAAGGHEVLWDGTGDDGELLAGEGNYTFTVVATKPETGASVSRKGNIIVRK